MLCPRALRHRGSAGRCPPCPARRRRGWGGRDGGAGFLPASRGCGHRRWHRAPRQRGNGGGGHLPADGGATAGPAPAPGDVAAGPWESGAGCRDPDTPSQGSPPGRGWDWCGAQGSSEQSWSLMGAALAPQPGTQPHRRPHRPHQHPWHKLVCEDKPGPGILLVPVAAGRVLPAKGAPGPGASSPSQGVRCGGAVGTGREGTPHPLTFPGLSWLTAFPAALCL